MTAHAKRSAHRPVIMLGPPLLLILTLTREASLRGNNGQGPPPQVEERRDLTEITGYISPNRGNAMELVQYCTKYQYKYQYKYCMYNTDVPVCTPYYAV